MALLLCFYDFFLLTFFWQTDQPTIRRTEGSDGNCTSNATFFSPDPDVLVQRCPHNKGGGMKRRRRRRGGADGEVLMCLEIVSLIFVGDIMIRHHREKQLDGRQNIWPISYLYVQGFHKELSCLGRRPKKNVKTWQTGTRKDGCDYVMMPGKVSCRNASEYKKTPIYIKDGLIY